jgi:S1-C subfamily serine protease
MINWWLFGIWWLLSLTWKHTPIVAPAPRNPVAVVEVADKKQSSVVKITGRKIIMRRNHYLKTQVPTMEVTEGTGFIVNDNGAILTNRHVVDDESESYTVTANNGMKYTIKNIYKDPANDIAMVLVDPDEHSDYTLIPIDLGDSTVMNTGDAVLSIGETPGINQPTLTTGEIGGIRTNLRAHDINGMNPELLYDMIQTDLDLVPGNSGSPLLNNKGQAIGINTAIIAGEKTTSFAIPIEEAKSFIGRLNLDN